jgi:hypothetical protein
VKTDTLHAELSALVGRHGLKNVTMVLEIIRDDVNAVSAPKRLKRAAVYEGRLLVDTGKAILWWIPPANNSVHGQAAWIPKALVASAIDNCPSDVNELPRREARRRSPFNGKTSVSSGARSNG